MEAFTEFLYALIQISSAVLALLLGGGAMWLIFAYGRSIVEARVIRLATVIFGAIILLAVGVGLRDYPAYLMRMATQGFNKLAAESPAFRASINNFAAQTVDEVDRATGGDVPIPTINPNAGGGVPTAVPLPTDVFTATPAVTETPAPPTPTLEAGELYPTPTLAPTATQTAVPTIDPNLWNPQTPAPTPNPGG